MLKIGWLSAFQCLDRTHLSTALAQDALCSVFAMARIVANLYIHRTYFKAFATFDAFALIAPDTYHRKVAHRFKEYRNRTDVLAECPIVLEE